MFNMELVGLMVVIVGGIASYVKLKVDQKNDSARLSSLENKQVNDHSELVSMQLSKDKDLWDEMKSFQKTLFEIGQSLGRLEGKIDFLRRDHE